MNGHKAMTQWDKTWRFSHLPAWAKKLLRAKIKQSGRSCIWTTEESMLDMTLFDHYGSIKRGAIRSLVAQPYGEHNEIAVKWADEMECSLESFTPGPWNQGTWCYIFTPRVYNLTRFESAAKI